MSRVAILCCWLLQSLCLSLQQTIRFLRFPLPPKPSLSLTAFLLYYFSTIKSLLGLPFFLNLHPRRLASTCTPKESSILLEQNSNCVSESCNLTTIPLNFLFKATVLLPKSLAPFATNGAYSNSLMLGMRLISNALTVSDWQQLVVPHGLTYSIHRDRRAILSLKLRTLQLLGTHV